MSAAMTAVPTGTSTRLRRLPEMCAVEQHVNGLRCKEAGSSQQGTLCRLATSAAGLTREPRAHGLLCDQNAA